VGDRPPSPDLPPLFFFLSSENSPFPPPPPPPDLYIIPPFWGPCSSFFFFFFFLICRSFPGPRHFAQEFTPIAPRSPALGGPRPLFFFQRLRRFLKKAPQISPSRAGPTEFCFSPPFSPAPVPWAQSKAGTERPPGPPPLSDFFFFSPSPCRSAKPGVLLGFSMNHKAGKAKFGAPSRPVAPAGKCSRGPFFAAPPSPPSFNRFC